MTLVDFFSAVQVSKSEERFWRRQWPFSGPNKPNLIFNRRLVLTFIPALLWIFLFTSGVSLIPDAAKPPINVTSLPWLDRRFFGSSATWFSKNNSSPSLDLLAAFVYSAHPTLPFIYIFSSAMYPPLRPSIPQFVATFGFMNLAAVSTHLLYPTAPPWYADKYGSAPANYSIKGDPAFLGRVDSRYHVQIFHHMYVDGGKIVFGAWPSLHAAWPYLILRFCHMLPIYFRLFVCTWIGVVWWAAVYLHHHFVVDIFGGVLYAEVALALTSLLFRRADVVVDSFSILNKPPRLPDETEPPKLELPLYNK